MKALVIEDNYLYERFYSMASYLSGDIIAIYDSFFDYSNNPEEEVEEVIHYNVDDSVVEYLNSKGIKHRALTISSGRVNDKSSIDLRKGYKHVINAILDEGNIPEASSHSLLAGRKTLIDKLESAPVKTYFYRFVDEKQKEEYIYSINNSSHEEEKVLVLDLDLESKGVFQEYFKGSGIFLMRAVSGKQPDFNKLLLSNSKNTLYFRMFSGGDEGEYVNCELIMSIIKRAKNFGVSKVVFVVTSQVCGIYALLGSMLGEYKLVDMKGELYGEAI